VGSFAGVVTIRGPLGSSDSNPRPSARRFSITFSVATFSTLTFSAEIVIAVLVSFHTHNRYPLSFSPCSPEPLCALRAPLRTFAVKAFLSALRVTSALSAVKGLPAVD
jgi:hypothetical protein